MSTKLIPFGKKKPPPAPSNAPIPFTCNGAKPSEDGKIVDHGSLGNLDYEIYARGVIHIFDKKSDKVRFKKDLSLFEKEIKELDFDHLLESGSPAVDLKAALYVIKGSGDNANLIFKKESGDIVLSLEKKGFSAIEKLKSVLALGKKKVAESQ